MEYRVGIDGLGLLMLLLSSIVVPIGMLASWQIEERVPLYYSLVLILQACLFGTFTALNFFHWFIFWELSLIPAFFLIRLWGGPRRTSAATQFLVYTMVGSITLLLAFIAIFLATKKFDFIDLAALAQNGQLMPAVIDKLAWHRFTPQHVALILFAGAFLGFAVKVPIFPFHTWLPSAYTEAPTGTTILLTGAMSKMGVYGFLRILLPIFGAQMQMVLTPLLWMAVATIVLSAYAALAQKDLKRIFAYSSINHLGYCLLANFCGSQVHRRRYGAYCREVCSNEWRFSTDVQSCTDCLNSVLVCRYAGKTQRRVARPGRFWRTAQGRACLYRTDGHRLVLHVGTAWPEWIYRGVPDLQRIVSAGDLGHFAFRPRTACHCNLYSWNSAARFLRAAQ